MRKTMKPRVAIAALGILGIALSGCATQAATDTPSEAEAQEANPQEGTDEQDGADEQDGTDEEGGEDAGALLYATKTSYAPFQDLSEYEEVPEGYEAVLVEHVARHGSRFLSSKKYDDLLYQLWEQAKADDGLTELGEELGPELEEITAIHDELGRSEEHTSELQSRGHLVCRLLLEKKK